MGKRSESRDPRSETEDPKVAKTTKLRNRSRELAGRTGKGAAWTGQVGAREKGGSDQGIHCHYNITPLPGEATKVVGEVNHLLNGLTGPMLKSVGTDGNP